MKVHPDFINCKTHKSRLGLACKDDQQSTYSEKYMDPEMKSVLDELITQLTSLQHKGASLLGHVDANHPDAHQVITATDSISTAIASLKKIGFGLESQTSYDD